MSKVTIKFWNKVRDEYEDEFAEKRYAVGVNEYVYFICSGTINEYLEPHFYKNGERIA